MGGERERVGTSQIYPSKNLDGSKHAAHPLTSTLSSTVPTSNPRPSVRIGVLDKKVNFCKSIEAPEPHDRNHATYSLMKSYKLHELRNWLSSNSKEDRWWLSIEDSPVDGILTLAEIEERLEGENFDNCCVLHSSQFESDPQEWIYLELGSPESNYSYSSQSPIILSNASNEAPQVPSKIRAFSRRLTGTILLSIPLVASLLIYIRLRNEEFNSESSPELLFILASMIVLTSIIVWIDAALNQVPKAMRGKRGGSKPAEWASLTAMFWIIGFPAYCIRRATTDQENGLMASLAVMAALFFSVSTMKVSGREFMSFIDYMTNYRGNSESGQSPTNVVPPDASAHSAAMPGSVAKAEAAETPPSSQADSAPTDASPPQANGKPTGVLGNLTEDERSALLGSKSIDPNLAENLSRDKVDQPTDLSRSTSEEIPLTGPKIVGVQLGMNLDEVIEILSGELPGIKFSSSDEQFENCATSVEGEFPNVGPKSEEAAISIFVAGLMGAFKGASVKLGANENGDLTYLEIGGSIVDKLFESGDMSDERFIQTFIDSYEIPTMDWNLDKVSGFSGGDFGTEGMQTSWTHESDTGFALKIYGESSSDNTALDSAKSKRTIELRKVKSAKEAKTRFR